MVCDRKCLQELVNNRLGDSREANFTELLREQYSIVTLEIVVLSFLNQAVNPLLLIFTAEYCYPEVNNS